MRNPSTNQASRNSLETRIENADKEEDPIVVVMETHHHPSGYNCTAEGDSWFTVEMDTTDTNIISQGPTREEVVEGLREFIKRIENAIEEIGTIDHDRSGAEK